MARALAPFRPRPRGFPPDLRFVWDAASLGNATILTLRTSAGDVDLLSEVAGFGGYADLVASSVQVEAFGQQIRSLDPRGLIKAKTAAGRPKDLAALPELESLLESEASD